MTGSWLCRVVRAICLAFLLSSLLSIAQAQGAKHTARETSISSADADHVQQRSEWFSRGRGVPGKTAADLRLRAYESKMQERAVRATGASRANSQSMPASGTWMPLGPVPLASDATASGFQDYHQVSGRATAVAIDPADPTGNTVYIGGAQGGVWKSTNAAAATANDVMWTAITDDQATLSIGSIAIQPGNLVPANSVVLVGTGEADNAADSYFGLGILRSTDAGSSWSLISVANHPTDNSTLSFHGLGATRMAFSTANNNAVVAAMAATSEGETDGALTSGTYRGLYTSTDAGLTWTYDVLFPGDSSQATSATSVVYNAAAGLFFAAVRYHGFYSSPDGLNWTLLAHQPGTSGLLNPTACPQNYATGCPIYRGEITVVPGRNEMYAWFISFDANNHLVDQGIWLGIWQSQTGEVSWAPIDESGIINCGDIDGCGVEQGFYNLELLAVPNCPNGDQSCPGNPTDLYAGAINLYKCSINSANPACTTVPFINLTHVYGCDPLGAPAHVHPDQHAVAYTIPQGGAEPGAALMYFANDGGIYRALDGFSGLTMGSCSGTNQFDDLNQNLGSMAQFVSFSQDPFNANTLLGGTQDNGSPATVTAAISLGWRNVLSGDGGYSAVDPVTGNWFASNPDTGSGGLNIQECPFGISCNDSLFNVVANSSNVGGDDGAFYFPYILDSQSATAMLVGTCRVWSGPRSGGVSFTALSINFDTLGIGTCAGTEVNVIRALATIHNSTSGAQVIYATTDGRGPNTPTSPVGGNVWVTTNATAVSGTVSNFANVTLNGPGSSSINANQFPVSGVAIDGSDVTGDTAYVTVMGFTGGAGHVWQTTNAGLTWADFTGTASALPDSPVNAVVVDSSTQMLYVGTDVGVFQSSTSAPAWTEVGPTPGAAQTGFLPNVAVTALALFDSACQKMLRASTYGRGIWQFNLPLTSTSPDFCLTESSLFPTVNAGSTTTQGAISITGVNGFFGAVHLACAITSGGGSCSVAPNSVNSFPIMANVTVDAATLRAGSYQISVLGTSGSTTNTLAIPFNVADFQLSGVRALTIAAGSQSSADLALTASPYYSGSVNVSCTSSTPANATCAVSPASPILVIAGSAVPIVANITVPSDAVPGVYNLTLAAQDTSGNPNHSLTIAVTVTQSTGGVNDFTLTTIKALPGGVHAAQRVTAKVGVTSNYIGSANAACEASALPAAICSIAPSSQVPISPGQSPTLEVTLTVPNSAAPQPTNAYNINVIVTDSSGQPTHTLTLPLTVIQDFSISMPTPSSQPINPGQQATYNFDVLPWGVLFPATVTLSQSMSCPGLTCSFTPGTVTPGSKAAAVLLTVTAPGTASLAALWSRPVVYAMWLTLPGLVFIGSLRPNRKKFALLTSLFGLLLLAWSLTSCGGGGSNGGSGGGGQQGTKPVTYTITVTGTAGALSHQAAPVTLIVQP